MNDAPIANVDGEPAWRQLKLSLERPYKDDSGNRIGTLYDITPEGEHVYEPKQAPSARLETNLRRIFIERGSDFFEKRDDPTRTKDDNTKDPKDVEDIAENDPDVPPKPMTVEELFAMRMEIIPQLFVALGEMTQARDLLTALLSSSGGSVNAILQGQQLPPQQTTSSLSATTVSKPAPIVSVQAFDSQLTVGGKDEALRKASKLFRTAAESMERSRSRGETYWIDALRARRANWGLSPAPLPLGSATGKGADKTSKDFMISYGLEGSPTIFRSRAVASLPTVGDTSIDVVFPSHQNTRLRTSIMLTTGTSTETAVFNSPRALGSMGLDTALKNAQVEIVDQEIFSLLVTEAGNLPTASAQVSERLIVINAAQGLDLSFELISYTNTLEMTNGQHLCELIYHVLHVLLLRKHTAAVGRTLAVNTYTKLREQPLPVLHPIIDILQYQVFCERIQVELSQAVVALNEAGVPSRMSFTPVGESGARLVALISDKGAKSVGGEVIIRINDWYTLRFTMASPSTLTAHLSQATLAISSLPQLSQLLMDEIERCLLQKICNLGREICSNIGGVWFVDLDRCIARWEGCIL
ncbi:subunit 17 of mediator complex-domain-containing protein [Crepidotus variabilis]|uniref:Mediator of RNA polymerase II transcription subunit 17 n=1 Tax=Crepidotus variabilis TaxID=179855 RepID=A0A9P6ESD1_9AGAR|nr:subunit 17 of mediator complex-domain-containing protein [Crepidotus variabilis]